MAETFICYTAMSTFYGCRATVHRVNATEHDTAYGAAPVRAIVPLTEVNATERDTSAASWQNVATEHFHPELPRAVCLSLADVATLRDAEKARTPQRSLHKLARETLNTITNAGVDSELDKNLDGWFPWKEYIACHNLAPDIVGPGVTHAIAEFIEGTRDANRNGQQRLDFVLYRLDGTHCRLHPGSKKANDAAPVFSSDGRVATEHLRARLQWSALPQLPFTYELAWTIPKIDQMGKKDAYRFLLSIPLGPLPTTSDASFKWWLFVCNLGKNTKEVLGPGIMAATLEEKNDKYALLAFARTDNTVVRLMVTPSSTRIQSTATEHAVV